MPRSASSFRAAVGFILNRRRNPSSVAKTPMIRSTCSWLICISSRVTPISRDVPSREASAKERDSHVRVELDVTRVSRTRRAGFDVYVDKSTERRLAGGTDRFLQITRGTERFDPKRATPGFLGPASEGGMGGTVLRGARGN